jgi:hypothetical protein
MKKALLVTLYDNFNYGNKLQNYAVYKLLNNYDIEVLNLKNNRHTNYKKTIFAGYIKFLISKIKYYFKHRNEVGWKYYHIRLKNFKSFASIIPTSKHYFNYLSINKYSEFDYLFVGSDQVWNPYMALDDLSLFNGFNSKNKIAISASFGVSNLNEKTKNQIFESLREFKMISVRENSGKKICDDILNNDSTIVLIDPTMAIDVDEWNKMVIKPKFNINKNYILVAFLGKCNQNIKHEINVFAKAENLEIVDIYEKNSIYTSCGPSEFLYLEKNASLILTDSFHSSVFGIMFNTPILVFDRNGTRENMNSRINTLLSKFKLEDRRYSGTIAEKNLICDYSESYKILEEERKKSADFLKKALDIKD